MKLGEVVVPISKKMAMWFKDDPNTKVLALSKLLTLMGYYQNFYVFHPILMKLGEVVITHQNRMKNKKF